VKREESGDNDGSHDDHQPEDSEKSEEDNNPKD
jgi:hypothetical protein